MVQERSRASGTLFDLFQKTLKRFGDSTALVFYGRKFTYSDLDRESGHFAAVLHNLGVEPGDRIAFVAPNTPHVPIAFLAAWRIGAVVAAVNPLDTPERVVSNLKLADPKVILVLENFDNHTRAIMEDKDLSSVARCRISFSVADYLPLGLKIGYKLKNFRKRFPSFQLNWKGAFSLADYSFTDQPQPEALAVLQFTGGTTGIPKAAMLTHANLIANTLQAIAHVNCGKEVVNGDSVFLGVLPFFHVYGLSVCLTMAFALGSSVVLLPKFEPKEVLAAIRKQRTTIFPGIQRMYAALNAYLEAKGGTGKSTLGDWYCQSLKLCFCGAGALNPDTRSRFESLTGATIIEGYGLSEASPIVSFSIPENNQPGSLGILVPDTEIKLVDGELWVRGPQVMSGYWRNEEESRIALPGDGWLATGDIVRMDENGFLWLIDRKKDMVKVIGENVYPQEIEKVIAKHPLIAEVAVIGMPDTKTGERVVACVVVRGEVSEAAIQNFCRENGLNGPRVPKEVQFVSEIPKNIIGKILKRELRQKLLGVV